MIPEVPAPPPPVEWHALPTPRWAPPLADSRSPLTAIVVRADDPIVIDTSLATAFPFVEARAGDVHAQLGLDAALFCGFQADGVLIFDFETLDGWFALPLDVDVGPWAARLEWSHTSAHFGDGVRDDGERPKNTGAWSREAVRLIGLRSWGPARFDVSAGAVVHAAPETEPLSFGAGAEVTGPWRIAPYAAVHLGIAADDAWMPSLDGQAGVRLNQRFRVAIVGRTGPEDTGKRRPAEERWIGALVGFDGPP